MIKQRLKYIATAAIFGASILASSVSFALAPDCTSVTERGDLVYCLAEENYIKLASNITYEGSALSYNRPGNSTTVDLNGFKVINTSTEPSDIFKIKAGTITFTGTGTIGSTDYDSLPIHIYGSADDADDIYTTVNIESNITLTAGDSYTLKVDEDSSRAHGVVVNFAGSSVAEKGFYTAENLGVYENHPVINILDGAEINATRGHAVVAAGYAKWNIGAADLTGNSGIGIRSGDLFIDGANVVASGFNNEVPTPNGDRIGMGNSGAAIQIEAVKGLTDVSDLYIKSGTFTSGQGYAIVEYAGDDLSSNVSLRTFKIYTGVLQGTQDFDDSVATSDTGALFWYHGDGRMMEAGGYVLETEDLYDSHKMTVARFANSVTGLEELREHAFQVDEFLPVFSPYEGLDYYDAEDLAKSEYKNSHIVNVFDISIRMFESDMGEPEPGMSRPYYLIGDTSEEYPITFNINFPDGIEKAEDIYVREYYILNFHRDRRTGEYKIDKIPVEISEDGKSYTFSTHEFSTFALAYVDTLPLVPNTGQGGQN